MIAGARPFKVLVFLSFPVCLSVVVKSFGIAHTWLGEVKSMQKWLVLIKIKKCSKLSFIFGLLNSQILLKTSQHKVIYDLRVCNLYTFIFLM